MARLYDKLFVIGVIVISLTGSITPAFSTYKHTPDDDSVTLAKILDAQITDLDIASNAAITQSKLAR